MAIRIGFVRIFVSDFERSFEFYAKSVGMEQDFSDNSTWAQFHAGDDISLAIELCAPDRVECGSKLVGRFSGVTLCVDDIAKAFTEMRARGVEFTSEPMTQPWGGTIAIFRDPDGNVLTLMESRDD